MALPLAFIVWFPSPVTNVAIKSWQHLSVTNSPRPTTYRLPHPDGNECLCPERGSRDLPAEAREAWASGFR